VSDASLDRAPQDDRAHNQFVIEQDGSTAVLVYRVVPGRMTLVHTEVPSEVAGRGFAGRLVRAAVDRAAAENLTVVPWCPYARKWLRTHPDAAKTVAIDWSDRPPSFARAPEEDTAAEP